MKPLLCGEPWKTCLSLHEQTVECLLLPPDGSLSSPSFLFVPLGVLPIVKSFWPTELYRLQ